MSNVQQLPIGVFDSGVGGLSDFKGLTRNNSLTKTSSILVIMRITLWGIVVMMKLLI